MEGYLAERPKSPCGGQLPLDNAGDGHGGKTKRKKMNTITRNKGEGNLGDEMIWRKKGSKSM